MQRSRRLLESTLELQEETWERDHLERCCPSGGE